MVLSFVLLVLITVGGFSLTYLFADDEPLLWRIAVGNVIGSTVFSLICFLLACFFSFSVLTVSVSILISLLPVLLFRHNSNRVRLRADWQRAKGKLEGASAKKFLRFGYYAFFFILFCLFFERAIIETAGAIFTGASQNYGDLPFHLGAIFSFTEGNNFPPENPSYAFAKFSYPFMADLITSALVKFGANFRDATFVQNVLLAFSLLIILERFTFKLTGSKLAGKIAPVLLFFSGGLGFLWFLKDYTETGKNFFDFLNALPKDYTISEKFRWGNSLVVLFVTQRSLLLGLPLTIVVLQKLWEIFASDKAENVELHRIESDLPDKKNWGFSIPIFLVGLLAGTLPLIHVHSLAVLFIVTAFLFFFRLDKMRDWLMFGAGVAVVAVPELIWVMTGSATRLTEFIAWNFGWDKRSDNVLWFWLKNTGAFLPVLIFGIYLVWEKFANSNMQESVGDDLEAKNKKKDAKPKVNALPLIPRPVSLLLFYLPFLFCFIIANLIKLAPWEWDNIKVLIYWFVASLPFAAFVLAWLWNQDRIFKIVAFGLLFVLTFAGALDVWRTVSKEINNEVFRKDSVAVAEQIKLKTAPNALFLNAPTFNSAVVLSGRRSLMRFTGHLLSYGIDYSARETDVKKIYAGDATAPLLLDKYKIEYVLISPEETTNLTVNEDFFRRFPVVAEAGQYRVYQVKK